MPFHTGLFSMISLPHYFLETRQLATSPEFCCGIKAITLYLEINKAKSHGKYIFGNEIQVLLGILGTNNHKLAWEFMPVGDN